LLLEVHNVELAYGEAPACRDISFEVTEGEIVALIGANGAGKTSTLRALSGLHRASAGRVIYDGADISQTRSHELVRRGMALVPEGRGVFGRLTVAENLRMGAYCRRDAEVAIDIDEVYRLFPRLSERSRQTAGTLSGGEQQMLAIGRALMSRPKLLLLDEPSMGLAPLMVQRIFETIVGIARRGVTLLLVEQNARLALEVCDHGYVMESGQITLSGAARVLLDDDRVRHAYLGE